VLLDAPRRLLVRHTNRASRNQRKTTDDRDNESESRSVHEA
jgi:hypothetical protein